MDTLLCDFCDTLSDMLLGCSSPGGRISAFKFRVVL